MSTSPGAPRSCQRYEWILFALCVIAALKFVVRGPARAAWNSGDFQAVYLSARASLHGFDPYDPAAVTRMWAEVKGPSAPPVSPRKARAVYPPPTFVLLRPLAFLPWRAAKFVWCAFNLVALGVFAMCLHGLARIRLREPRSLLLIAFLLALEPTSTAVMLGQLSIVVAALASASLLNVQRRSETSGGFLEGLALGFKPQVAAAYLAPYILERRWRACIAVALTTGALCVVALAGLRGHPGWLRNYASDVDWWYGKAATDELYAHSPGLIQLINLRYPLSILLGNNLIAMYLAAAIAFILAIHPIVLLVRRGSDAVTLHCVSILTLVELIFSYHRGYDAVVVGFPIAWALSPQVPRRHGLPALIAAAMFILPSGVGVRALGEMPWFPAGITTGLLWNGFVVPYQAWALLLMASWMNYCLLRRGE